MDESNQSFVRRAVATFRLARAQEWQRGDVDRLAFYERRKRARQIVRRTGVIVVAVVVLVTVAVSVATTQLNTQKTEREFQPLRTFVEQHRHLRFTRTVPIHLLTSEQFDALPVADTSWLLGAMDKIYPVLSPLGIDFGFKDPSGAVVALQAHESGIYDPNTKAVYVRGTTLTPFIRRVIVHELTHALDDQHFDFSDSGAMDTQAGNALVEGDAVRIERAYVETLPEPQRTLAGAITTRETRLSDIPPALSQYFAFPYDSGVSFVDALARAGPTEVDRAFMDPPAFVEEVLDPSLYLDQQREDALTQEAFDVPTPLPVGSVLIPPSDYVILGELFLRIWLVPALGEQAASRVAAHWTGDKTIAWTAENGTSCVRVYMRAGSPTDHRILLDGLKSWAQSRRGAIVKDGSPISVLSCS